MDFQIETDILPSTVYVHSFDRVVCAPLCTHGIVTFYKVHITESFTLAGTGSREASYASLAELRPRVVEMKQNQCLCRQRALAAEHGLQCVIELADAHEVCHCHIHPSTEPIDSIINHLDPETSSDESSITEAPTSSEPQPEPQPPEPQPQPVPPENTSPVFGLTGREVENNKLYNHCYTCLKTAYALSSISVRVLLIYLVFSSHFPTAVKFLYGGMLLLYMVLYSVFSYKLTHTTPSNVRLPLSAAEGLFSVLGAKSDLPNVFINLLLLSTWALYTQHPHVPYIVAMYSVGVLVPCLGLVLILNDKYQSSKFLEFCPPLLPSRKKEFFLVPSKVPPVVRSSYKTVYSNLQRASLKRIVGDKPIRIQEDRKDENGPSLVVTTL